MEYNNYKYQSDTPVCKEGDAIHPRAVDIFVEIVGFDIANSLWNNYHDAVIEQLSDAIFEAERIKNTIKVFKPEYRIEIAEYTMLEKFIYGCNLAGILMYGFLFIFYEKGC